MRPPPGAADRVAAGTHARASQPEGRLFLEGEAGRAALGAALLIAFIFPPLILALPVLSDGHRALLATSAAAREAARAYVRAADADHASSAALARAREVASAHGLDPALLRLEFSPDFDRGAELRFTARYPVDLAPIPILGIGRGTVWVSQSHRTVLDPHASR